MALDILDLGLSSWLPIITIVSTTTHLYIESTLELLKHY